jgi:hypothetical protein
MKVRSARCVTRVAVAVTLLLPWVQAESQLPATSPATWEHYFVQVDVSTLKPEEVLDFHLVRRAPEYQPGSNPEWWLAFLDSALVSKLTQRGFPLVPRSSVQTQAGSQTEGSVMAPGLNDCTTVPSPGTFCAYDTPNAWCAQSITQQIDTAPLTYPPIYGPDPGAPITYVDVFDLPDLTSENRPIKAVRVGPSHQPGTPPKPQVVIVGGQHAREWVSVEFAMRLWKHYAVSYQYDRPGYRTLLDQVSLLVIPVANPDGYEFTHLPTGQRMWRPNRNTCSGGMGIDPNRNFPFDFGEPGATSSCPSIPYQQENSSYHGAEASPHLNQIMA